MSRSSPKPRPDAARSPEWADSSGWKVLPSWQIKARYLLVSMAILVLDQWTKWLIEHSLSERMEVIPGLLNFTYVRNTGVAFGLFAANGATTGTVILTVLGLGALAVVTYYFAVVPAGDRIMLVALALVLGGAIGNLLDRILSGAVTDFIDFYFGTYHWHTFNVADSAITIGIGLIILVSLRKRPPEPTSEGP